MTEPICPKRPARRPDPDIAGQVIVEGLILLASFLLFLLLYLNITSEGLRAVHRNGSKSETLRREPRHVVQKNSKVKMGPDRSSDFILPDNRRDQ